MSENILRYLQLKVTLEQARDSPGVVLTDYFTRMELISYASGIGLYPEYLINLHYSNEVPELEDFSIDGVFKVTSIISESESSALVIAQLHGPILVLIHQINECWIKTPTFLTNSNGLFLTIHGTTNGLKEFRDGIKNLFPDTVKMRITKDLKADWIATPQLPQRRKEVIDLAVERGYYKTPRKCTQRELADELGVRQGTVAEHLQSAEGLIIESWSAQSNNS
jgi:hypothetical protein